MGVSLWFFQETAAGQMKRLPSTKFHQFYEGRASISDHTDGALQTAQVVVDLQDRCLAQVLRVFWPKYAMTAGGYIDETHKRASMILVGRIMGGILDTDDVVSLDPHLARQDMQRSHQWRPSEEQLQQVADVLNRAAIRAPVVAVARGELVPL